MGPRFAADAATGGGLWFAVPLGGVDFMNFERAAERASPGTAVIEEALGSRQLEGIVTVGSLTLWESSRGEFARKCAATAKTT